MIDGTRLASLVASKICHDMVEPMSAMFQGLDLLKETDVNGKNADAIRLLEHGINKSLAKLEFYRYAMAGGIGGEGEGALDEIRAPAQKLFSILKPDLVWSAPAAYVPKAALRVALNILMTAAQCLPRGGTVTVEAGKAEGGVEIRIIAAGQRARLQPDTMKCLAGQTPEDGFHGHNVQPMLTGMLARQSDVELAAREAPERIEFVLRSANFRLQAAAA